MKPSSLDDSRVLELVNSFVDDFKKLSSKMEGRSIEDMREDIHARVFRRCKLIIFVFNQYKEQCNDCLITKMEDEDLHLQAKYKSMRLEYINKEIIFLINMTGHDKRYFDGLKIALLELVSQELALPKLFGEWIKKVIERGIAAPKGNCPSVTSRDGARGEMVTMILYTLKYCLELNPTANDTKKDGVEGQEFVCGADYLAEVLKLSYKTIVRDNSLTAYEKKEVSLKFDFLLINWIPRAKRLMSIE